MKTIPDRASVHTQKLCFRRGFCDGAKLRRDDLESVVSQYTVGEILFHTLLQREHLLLQSRK